MFTQEELLTISFDLHYRIRRLSKLKVDLVIGITYGPLTQVRLDQEITERQLLIEKIRGLLT